MDRKIQKIIVSGIITNEKGEVLLAQRPLHKQIAPGSYHIPGGHIEFGETPEEAIIREIWEELSLNIIPNEVLRTFSYIIDNSQTIGITFALTINNSIDNIIFDKQDTESIVWVDKNTINKYLKDTDHDYITLRKFFSK